MFKNYIQLNHVGKKNLLKKQLHKNMNIQELYSLNLKHEMILDEWICCSNQSVIYPPPPYLSSQISQNNQEQKTLKLCSSLFEVIPLFYSSFK